MVDVGPVRCEVSEKQSLTVQSLTAEEMTPAMDQLHGVSMAAWRQLPVFVAEYDRAEAYRADGAPGVRRPRATDRRGARARGAGAQRHGARRPALVAAPAPASRQGLAVAGCRRIRGVHALHIEWFSRGGRTVIDNLVLLCRRHHRAVHEGGWRRELRFLRPDGRALDSRPPPLREDLREWLRGVVPSLGTVPRLAFAPG